MTGREASGGTTATRCRRNGSRIAWTSDSGQFSYGLGYATADGRWLEGLLRWDDEGGDDDEVGDDGKAGWPVDGGSFAVFCSPSPSA
ncbi:hypothetical protein TWF694_008416 [Orbilia ellipsospora]|uniref:Uncharacterized protein n=1 Tax=Orbilia ellipsospora TaxID=2528407 RepID=A0AAV9XG34_9PEZI